MTEPLQILKQYWGYNAFRPLQEDIINSVLQGRDTLALLPTGGGKSVCYQVPALMKEGVCLVVSPLIALMQDQVARLKQLDIPAVCLHSGLHYSEVRRLLDNTVQDAYKLLYVSPERLQTSLFRDYMTELDVSMIAVDEAHCISQWGHDFRPSYLKIADIRDTYPNAPMLALTATATRHVEQDIALQLRMKDTAAFKQSFARNNIYYTVDYSENKNGDTAERVNRQCSIVYTRSRRQTEVIGDHLGINGVPATVYHAGMDKEHREAAQGEWMSGKTPVMVATTAFGMGIDKPDVRMVLHYDAPEHPEAYYQEAGRAGRDGKYSDAIALYNAADIKRLHGSTELQYPPEEYLRRIYQAVAEYLQIPIGTEPDRYYPFDLFDFSRKFGFHPNEAIHGLKLLEQEGLWTLSESVYSPATVQFTADRHLLDDLGQMYPELAFLAIGLLRMYNTIFHYPTSVRESAIARQLKMNKEDVERGLLQLHHMELLEYNKPGEGPQLFFHHYRVDSRYLIIDLERIHVLRKHHEERTKAMINFLENRTECREQILLTYFGEDVTADCGHCDNCSRKRKTEPYDMAQLEREIVYIAGMTTDGIATKELLGRFSAAMKEQVVTCVRAMIDDGKLLLKDGSITVPVR